MTPSDEATVSLDDADTPRQYSTTGLDDDTTYDIILVDADDVTVSATGAVSFDDTDDNGEYETGAVAGAHLSVVNGGATTTTPDAVEAGPVNGTISFTVAGTDYTSVIPVVLEDTENDGDVELNADDMPTEPFGIGGQFNVLPAEAGTGTIGVDTEVEQIIDNGDGTYSIVLSFVSDPDGSGSLEVGDFTLVEANANDTFYISPEGEDGDDDANDVAGDNDTGGTDDDISAAEQVTAEDFLAELSVGDEFDDDTFYQASDSLTSQHVLEDLAPVAPTGLVEVDTDQTSTVLTVQGYNTSASQVTVYGTEDGTTVSTSSDVYATATADADADTTGFQVEVTGLTPGTTYDFAATQTVSGEESALSPEEEVSTPTEAEAIAPTVTDAVLDTDAVVVGLADSGDQASVTFSEGTVIVDSGTDGANWNDVLVDLTDADGDLIRVQCNDASATVTPDATDGVTQATCAVTDESTTADPDETIQITLLEDAEDRNAAGDEFPGDIEYNLTIIDILNVEDADGNEVDLANSADVVIDDEAQGSGWWW